MLTPTDKELRFSPGRQSLTNSKVWRRTWRAAFAHCSHLEQLSLAKRLRRIGREAFLKCISLREVHTPPPLLCIAHRAFAGCTQLSKLHKMEAKWTWRGPYVERSAFDKCHQFDIPDWINLLPPNQGSSSAVETDDFYEMRKDPR